MKSGCNEKVSYRITPCSAPGSGCAQYADSEYDPCESSDDITDKDIAELLKAERLSQQKGQPQKDEGQPVCANGVEGAEGAEGAESAKVADGAEGTEREFRPCQKKKRNCKKIIKNPFFTNRLNFDSDLPPPPPEPPPQFFPPVVDSNSKNRINCLKRKRKCKKRSDDGRKECETKDGWDGDTQGLCKDEETQQWVPCEKEGSRGSECEGVDCGGCIDDDDDDKKIRRCVKNRAKFPCRKKVSEVSISLQPRQIPAAQRNLPPTCPKVEAIMEQEKKMGCVPNCDKRNCHKKKHCSK